ncbi:hypothetical protein AAFF_G00428090 [Aldrovandia affinis]|uniref:Uncharacterized protein n=1 Tax=Aldrovandia affinis TaxID=143900 RepID=A0AAD7S950_9TELE|nr:hypothetical protein AAFF_G00428090 [Aldrovandia affinis]
MHHKIHNRREKRCQDAGHVWSVDAGHGSTKRRTHLGGRTLLRPRCEGIRGHRVVPEWQQQPHRCPEILSRMWSHCAQRVHLLPHCRNSHHRQVSPPNQETAHPGDQECPVPQPQLSPQQLQDLLQTGGGRKRPVAHLRVQRGRQRNGGTSGREDVLRHLLHQHHLSQDEGGERLRRLRSALRHGHERRKSDIRLRPPERETREREFRPPVADRRAGHAVLQTEESTSVRVGRQLRQNVQRAFLF